MDISPYIFDQPNQIDNCYSDPCTNDIHDYGVQEASLWLEAKNKRSFAIHNEESSCYRNEYNWLLSEMVENMTENTLEKLLHVSELGDEALQERGQNHEISDIISESEEPPMFRMEELLQWKRCQDRKHELFMLQQ